MPDKKILIIAIVSFIAVIIIITLLNIFSPKASINITSEPDNIDVYIDNVKYKTPFILKNIKKDKVTIYGSKEGYQLYTHELIIKEVKEYKIHIVMESIGEEPLEGAPDPQEEEYLNLATTQQNFSIKLADQQDFDLEINLNATFNAGVNGPPIEDQEKLYKQELTQYKKEALAFIESKGFKVEKIKIYWVPKEAKNL